MCSIRCSMVSVCVSVGHDCGACKNGCVNRDAVWGVDSWGPKDRVIGGGQDPTWEWALFRVILVHARTWLRSMVSTLFGSWEDRCIHWLSLL